MIQLVTAGNEIVLKSGACELATRKELVVRTPEEGIETFPVKLNDNIFECDLGKHGYYKEFLTIENDILTGEIELKVKTGNPFIIQCPFTFPKSMKPPYFMIPGFLYGSNNLETSDGP